MLRGETLEFNEDYTQSANTLFHFMTKQEYLEDLLFKKAIIPRYCREDIRYLNLNIGGVDFKEIAILQKCFCDIPLHKIMTQFPTQFTEESRESLKSKNIPEPQLGFTHPECYGKFAIAFSKDWCEESKLQPIHYINEKSVYIRDLMNLFIEAYESDNLADNYVIDILQRLALIKPLRGRMKRPFDLENSNHLSLEIHKNFHDEQEWRYIVDSKVVERLNEKNENNQLELVIANPYKLKIKEFIDIQSEELRNAIYSDLWLKYEYNAVKYLIVPDGQARMNLIKLIMNLPDNNFIGDMSIQEQKYVLISKILVLNEIRKDW